MKTKITLLLILVVTLAGGMQAQGRTSLATNVQNGSFEEWKLREFLKCCGRNTDIPWYWGITEQLTGLNYNKFTFLISDTTIVHSGVRCIELFSDTTYLNNLVLIPGVVAYGQMTDSASTGITISPVIESQGLPLPQSSNPVSLNFFMRMDHNVTDTPYYMCVLTKWDSLSQTEDTVAYSQVDIPDNPENYGQWVEYIDSLHYRSDETADTVRILFFGGRFGDSTRQGNATYLDDVNLYYPATGLVSLTGQPVLQVFPNPANSMLTLKTGQYQPGNTFNIFDVLGQRLQTIPVLTQTTQADVSSLPPGIYLFQLTGKSGQMLQQGKFEVVR